MQYKTVAFSRGWIGYELQYRSNIGMVFEQVECQVSAVDYIRGRRVVFQINGCRWGIFHTVLFTPLF